MFNKELDGFISYLNLQKRASPLTTASYQNDINQFITFLETETHTLLITEITFQHIRGFIAQLMDNGLSARSVNRKLSSLKSFFKYLLKNQLVNNNPAQKVQGLKTPKKLPVFVDEIKLRIFLKLLNLKKVLMALETN